MCNLGRIRGLQSAQVEAETHGVRLNPSSLVRTATEQAEFR